VIGGQGTVWAALRIATGDKVALKVIGRDHLADPQARARFEQGYDTLNLLDHTGIVRGIERGELPTGELWHATEYVSGRNILEYVNELDAQRLRGPSGRPAPFPADAVVGLFVKVCEAVEAAHQAGVIHRDLKPGNILVDDKGQPRLLDFGLARSPDARTPELVTLTDQFLGSPEYASPEQVLCRPGLVDVRSDVYSLGVVLYRLMTGRFPYDVAGPLHRTFDQVLHADPWLPRSITPRVSRDLQAVLLKSLQKQPERRYQAVCELRKDLEHYLRHEPVNARPDSFAYRGVKWARRHPAPAVAVAALLLFGIVYTATVTVLYQRATTAEQKALAKADESRRLFGHALAAADLLIGKAEEQLRHLPGASQAREAIVREAMVELEALTGVRSDDPSVQADLAEAHQRIGDFAFERRDMVTAERHRQEALAIRRTLAAYEPDNPEFQRTLSISLVLVGDLAKERGDLGGTRALYDQARTIHEELVRSSPENNDYLDTLSWSYERLGDIARLSGDMTLMMDLYRRRHELAKQLVHREPESADYLYGLCVSHGLMGQSFPGTSEELQHMVSAVQIGHRLMELDPDNDRHAFCLMNSEGALATRAYLGKPQDLDAAEQHWKAVAKISQELFAREPEKPSYQEYYARSRFDLGQVAADRGDFLVAQREFVTALRYFEVLAGRDPANQHAADALTVPLVKLADSIQRHGLVLEEPVAAMKLAERSLDLLPPSRAEEKAQLKAVFTEYEQTAVP
jgi:tetratricopeptide (TPR) repeat protein